MEWFGFWLFIGMVIFLLSTEGEAERQRVHEIELAKLKRTVEIKP